MESSHPPSPNIGGAVSISPDANKTKKRRDISARLYNVVFLGESGVGKSSICLNIVHKNESSTLLLSTSVMESNATVGVDFELFDFTSRFTGVSYRFHLWDTGGQERFASLVHSYIRQAQIAFIVFSFGDPASFEHIKHWHTVFKQSCNRPNAVCILLGNKSDLKSKTENNNNSITQDRIDKIVHDLELDYYFECCALQLSVPVTDIFEVSIQRLHYKNISGSERRGADIIELKADKKQKKDLLDTTSNSRKCCF